MIYHDVEPQSAAWFQLRLGIPTASEFDRILTPKTLKLSKQADVYMFRLLAEWMTGTPFTEEVKIWSTSIEDGIAREQQSVEYFELVSGEETEPAGFCTTENGLIGASPDRFFDNRQALLEVKNPIASTHVGWLLEGGLPAEHVLQCQGQLLVTGLTRHVFLSLYPGLPPLLIESQPDEQIQYALLVALDQFCRQMLEAREQLKALGGWEHANQSMEAR